MSEVKVEYRKFSHEGKFYDLIKLTGPNNSFIIGRYGKNGTNGRLTVKEFTEINHAALANNEFSSNTRTRESHDYKYEGQESHVATSMVTLDRILSTYLGAVHFSKIATRSNAMFDGWVEEPEKAAKPEPIVGSENNYSSEVWGTW